MRTTEKSSRQGRRKTFEKSKSRIRKMLKRIDKENLISSHAAA